MEPPLEFLASSASVLERASMFVTAESWAALRPLGPCVGGLIATMVSSIDLCWKFEVGSHCKRTIPFVEMH